MTGGVGPASPTLSTSTRPGPAAAVAVPTRLAVVGVTLLLFAVWSHTFLAFELLLAPKAGAPPMDWLDLVVARFSPVALFAVPWCLLVKRRESWAAARAHPKRLVLGALLAVPVYNAVLYVAIEHRVSGPVASLLTTLAPLWLVVLGRLLLHERIGPRKVAGLLLGFAGVVVVASAKGGDVAYAGAVLVGALAPLAWSLYSALTKPATRTVDPLVWTYLVLAVGSAPLLPLLPFRGGPAMARLDAWGWGALLFLAVGGTIFGNAVWSWLLRHLPASTVGFTVFLNPPMTTAGKRVLATAFPATFAFAVSTQEWVGGALALAGIALAVAPRPPRASQK